MLLQLCPDSKSAYPGLKALAEHYAPEEFRLKFVLFPLPYHQHAFAAAESTYTITSALGTDQFTPWLETMYANQDMYVAARMIPLPPSQSYIGHVSFWNKATKDLTPVQVVDKLHSIAKGTFPALTDAQWAKGMTGYGGTDADDQARIAWKYSCARGKSGTPLYTLNGVPFDADADWTLEQWLDVIDPLVKANKPTVEEATVATTNNMIRLNGVPPIPDRQVTRLASAGAAARVCEGVAGGVRPCEFLPSQAMCCQQGEACVLRAGCIKLA